MFWLWLIFFVASFVSGAIPFGLLITRLRTGSDIRQSGSGNIGATNVARTAGLAMGVLTLILDVGKGLVPVLAARFFLGFEGPWGEAPAAVCGLAAFWGHIYSPFLKFKGGKGVAAALGVYAGLMPLTLIPALAALVIVIWKWRYVSVGSMTAAVAVAILCPLFGYPTEVALVAAVMAVFIILRHRENISRLRQGIENKWGRK